MMISQPASPAGPARVINSELITEDSSVDLDIRSGGWYDHSMMISRTTTPHPFASLTVRQLEDLGDAIDQIALTVPGTAHLAATLVEVETEIARRVFEVA